jgi:hypothetical protein
MLKPRRLSADSLFLYVREPLGVEGIGTIAASLGGQHLGRFASGFAFRFGCTSATLKDRARSCRLTSVDHSQQADGL